MGLLKRNSKIYNVKNMSVSFVQYYYSTYVLGQYPALQSKHQESRDILDFKEGMKTEGVKKLVSNCVDLVSSIISKNKYKKWSIFCIPASSKYASDKRYDYLIKKLKERFPNVDFINDYVQFTGEKSRKHNNLTSDEVIHSCSHIRLTKNIHSDKVLILDDVITKGNSMLDATEFLQDYGAYDFAYCALAKTWYGKEDGYV